MTCLPKNHNIIEFPTSRVNTRVEPQEITPSAQKRPLGQSLRDIAAQQKELAANLRFIAKRYNLVAELTAKTCDNAKKSIAVMQAETRKNMGKSAQAYQRIENTLESGDMGKIIALRKELLARRD